MHEITKETLIKAFMEEFLPTHGLPSKMVSDRGPQFISEAFEGLAKNFNIELVHSTAKRPQSNGMVEKAVKAAKDLLHTMIEDNRNVP